MTALAQFRADSAVREVTRDARPMAAGEVGFKGGLCVILLSGASKGFYANGDSAQAAENVAVGRFYEDFDNSGGADGDISVQVDFLRERHLLLLHNDTAGTPVVAADREGGCYVLDDQTVTMAVNTSAGGTVYDVTSEGAWVEIDQATLSDLVSAPGLSNVAPVDVTNSVASAGVAALAARQDHKHQIDSIGNPVADMTALKAIAATGRADGMIVGVIAGTGGGWELWRFSAASAAADTTESLVATPAAGTGRWLRLPGDVTLTLPITFANADNSTIFTSPAGSLFHPREAWFDVTADWTGGVASAIGVHCSVVGWDTKGDILGGAGGDVAATLVAASFPRMTGTIGTKLATRTLGRLIMKAADTLKFDRIVSVFGAGTGNVRVVGDLLTNPGA